MKRPRALRQSLHAFARLMETQIAETCQGTAVLVVVVCVAVAQAYA